MAFFMWSKKLPGGFSLRANSFEWNQRKSLLSCAKNQYHHCFLITSVIFYETVLSKTYFRKPVSILKTMFCTETEHFKLYLAPGCNLHALSSLKTTQGRVLRKQQDHVAPSMIDEWVEIHRIGIDYYLKWICLQVWMSGIAMQLTLKWVWIWLSNKYWLLRPNKAENTKSNFVWENSSFFETEVLNIEEVIFSVITGKLYPRLSVPSIAMSLKVESFSVEKKRGWEKIMKSPSYSKKNSNKKLLNQLEKKRKRFW